MRAKKKKNFPMCHMWRLQRARSTAIHNKPAYIFFFFLRLIVPEFILLGLVEYGTPKLFLGGNKHRYINTFVTRA